MLIDTHCHLDDARYDSERAAMLMRARNADITTMITIGCDLASSQRALGIAKTHSDVMATVGIHPHESAKAPQDFISELKAMAIHKKCVAIGECGLDYFYDHSPRDVQQAVFRQQMRLAKEVKKTLVVHVRDAYDDCLRLFKEETMGDHKIVIHCFTGTLADAQNLLDFGCYLSISGVVTFKNSGELSEVVKQVPLNRLLIETDAPYLAPIPYRGKRNEPAFVTEVAKTIALCRDESFEEIAQQTSQNARKVFDL